jgi:geranylgeranyl pyrophosphate synthase
MGLAYQIQDDILDFTAAATVLGKPALADMDLGLSTAPILYAAQEFPHLRPLVMRRFKEKGDKQAALEALYKSEKAMDKARALARFHAQVRSTSILVHRDCVQTFLTLHELLHRELSMRCYGFLNPRHETH